MIHHSELLIYQYRIHETHKQEEDVSLGDFLINTQFLARRLAMGMHTSTCKGDDGGDSNGHRDQDVGSPGPDQTILGAPRDRHPDQSCSPHSHD